MLRLKPDNKPVHCVWIYGILLCGCGFVFPIETFGISNNFFSSVICRDRSHENLVRWLGWYYLVISMSKFGEGTSGLWNVTCLISQSSQMRTNIKRTLGELQTFNLTDPNSSLSHPSSGIVYNYDAQRNIRKGLDNWCKWLHRHLDRQRIP